MLHCKLPIHLHSYQQCNHFTRVLNSTVKEKERLPRLRVSKLSLKRLDSKYYRCCKPRVNFEDIVCIIFKM